MRTAITATITFLGIAIGALSADGAGLASQLVMGCIGAMFSFPIGAGVAALVHLSRGRPFRRQAMFDDSSVKDDPQLDNYWLDRGRLTAAPDMPHLDDLDHLSKEP